MFVETMEDCYEAKWVADLGSKTNPIAHLAVCNFQYMWQPYLEMVTSRKN
jgi:hypothetical protein